MIGGYWTVGETIESYHCKNAINLMRLCEGRGELGRGASSDRGPVITTGAGHHRGQGATGDTMWGPGAAIIDTGSHVTITRVKRVRGHAGHSWATVAMARG